MRWGSVCPMHPELEGERYNGGNCPACTKITKAAYNERTREKRLAEMRKRRERNLAKTKSDQLAWANNNRDHIRCSNLRSARYTRIIVTTLGKRVAFCATTATPA